MGQSLVCRSTLRMNFFKLLSFLSFAAAFSYHDFKKRSMPNPIDMFMSKRTVGDAMYDYMINNGNVEKRARSKWLRNKMARPRREDRPQIPSFDFLTRKWRMMG